MKIRPECVSPNWINHLTVNKWYDVEEIWCDGTHVIIDDIGYELWVDMTDNNLTGDGNWEVMEEYNED